MTEIGPRGQAGPDDGRDGMSDGGQNKALAHLEARGDAVPLAATLHGLIERSPLFENFSLSEIRLLSHFMQVYFAPSGTEVIHEGDAGDFMMLLVEGRIEVLKRDRWNAQRLIAVLAPGQTVGEMSMIDGEPRFASCTAVEDSLFTVLSRESLARIILEQPVLGAKILMELVMMLSQRLRHTSARLMQYLDREDEHR
ncbi:MAG TPA: cyclic nucleotide-binding domain-containing protein [Burkholderiales bacterium]|nr:cyclic nucleotide-binding domain-containing protein [Burkholderiales bacterium]